MRKPLARIRPTTVVTRPVTVAQQKAAARVPAFAAQVQTSTRYTNTRTASTPKPVTPDSYAMTNYVPMDQPGLDEAFAKGKAGLKSEASEDTAVEPVVDESLLFGYPRGLVILAGLLVAGGAGYLYFRKKK